MNAKIIGLASFLALALALHADEIDVAVLQTEQGESDTAAKILGRSNSAETDSLVWFQQSALRLLDRAETLRATGDYETARRAALAAIRLMQHGLKAAASSAAEGDVVQMYLQLAEACETHLGDDSAAFDYYRSALRTRPVDAYVKDAIARFQLRRERLEKLEQEGGN